MRHIEYWNDADSEEKSVLNASEWQINLLNKNPDYNSWGCFEDYMSRKSEDFQAPVTQETWKDFGPWELDDYNELVNFYFEVSRAGHNCAACNGSGLNVETKQLSDDWYDFAETGKRWRDKLTDVEVFALAKEGRLSEFVKGHFDKESGNWMEWVNGEKVILSGEPAIPSALVVNEAYKTGFGHDSLNHWICVKARAEHLGVYGKCPKCSHGTIYDEPSAHVSLQLWLLHPRKGASRGVYIKKIEETEIPEVLEYLKKAAERNAKRFEKL